MLTFRVTSAYWVTLDWVVLSIGRQASLSSSDSLLDIRLSPRIEGHLPLSWKIRNKYTNQFQINLISLQVRVIWIIKTIISTSWNPLYERASLRVRIVDHGAAIINLISEIPGLSLREKQLPYLFPIHLRYHFLWFDSLHKGRTQRLVVERLNSTVTNLSDSRYD